MSNLVSGMVSSLDVRQYELNGKIFTSFTPHLEGAVDKYQIKDGYSCDVVQFITFCMNNPGSNSLREYVHSTLCALAFNNGHLESYDELYHLFTVWILNWRGNEEICDRDDVKRLARDFEQTLTSLKMLDDLKEFIISYRIKSHWYPLEVELLHDNVLRKTEKARLRSQAHSSSIVEELISETELYKTRWWNISPTARYLSDATDNSVTTVYKYGKPYYIDHKENTSKIIKKLKDFHPTGTVKEFIESVKSTEGLELSVSTVRRYLK